MKHLKNILEGILSDIDVTLNDTDKSIKKIAALNTKADTFEEFIKAFVDYFDCKMPKIKKGKGTLSFTGFRNRKYKFGYENADVADIKISHESSTGNTRILYVLKFVKNNANTYYFQIKSTYISGDHRMTGWSYYDYYNLKIRDITVKDFIKTILGQTSAFDKIFDKNDFN